MPSFSPHELLHDRHWRRVWRWVWALLAAVLGVATLTPGELATGMTSNDKLDHLLGFGVLAAAGLLALAPARKHQLTVGLGTLAYGALIELLQTQVPGRSGELHDVLADALGVVLGITVVGALRWRFRDAAH